MSSQQLTNLLHHLIKPVHLLPFDNYSRTNVAQVWGDVGSQVIWSRATTEHQKFFFSNRKPEHNSTLTMWLGWAVLPAWELHSKLLSGRG